MSNPNDGQGQGPPPLSGYDEMRRINRESSGNQPQYQNLSPQQQFQQMQQEQQQSQGQKMVLSPEEERVMRSCQSESFWYRSIPASSLLSALTLLGVQNGYLKPNPRWGSRPKVLLATVVGYFMGKFSYVNECADKFLIEAADGQVAEKIRIQRGMAPREPREGHVDNSSASEFGQVNQQSPVFNNPNSPTFNPNRGPPEQQLSGYEEMRRRNRESAGPPGFTPTYQPSQQVSNQYQTLTPPPPSAESSPPSKLRPLPSSGSNKYGDEGFE